MLIPCEGCKRHVRVTDAACPFCGAAIGAGTTRPLLEGRLSRAAVFASALVVAPACIVQNPPPPNYQQQQQQPPPPPPPDYQTGQNPEYAQPPPDYQRRPPQSSVVRGRVIDANGLPLRNLRIKFSGGQVFTTVTDDQGDYAITGMPAGEYTVMVPTGERQTVSVVPGKEAIVNFSIAARQAPPYDRSNIPKPYGAPPARKRLV